MEPFALVIKSTRTRDIHEKLSLHREIDGFASDLDIRKNILQFSQVKKRATSHSNAALTKSTAVGKKGLEKKN